MRLNKAEKLKFFQDYNIYGITAEKFSNGRSNIEVVKHMLVSGIKIIQYREKYKTLKEKYHECMEIRKLTLEYGALLIVNDHVDLCMMCGADGVHIGQNDFPPLEVRKMLGNEYIIGLTTHTKEQILEVVQEASVDYVGVGPVFQSFTKDNPLPPIGLDIVRWASENCKIPFVAIGGIKEHNLKEVLDAGAKCIALVTEIVGAENISFKVKRIWDIINAKKSSY